MNSLSLVYIHGLYMRSMYRFPLYAVCVYTCMLLTGCAVPLVGMSDDSCDSINQSAGGIALCHRSRTVGQYMGDVVAVQRCGSFSSGRDGDRHAPWDSECLHPNEPVIQRSGPVWNPAVDPAQAEEVRTERRIIQNELLWCRTSPHAQQGLNRQECLDQRRRYASGEWRQRYGITGEEGW